MPGGSASFARAMRCARCPEPVPIFFFTSGVALMRLLLVLVGPRTSGYIRECRIAFVAPLTRLLGWVC